MADQLKMIENHSPQPGVYPDISVKHLRGTLTKLEMNCLDFEVVNHLFIRRKSLFQCSLWAETFNCALLSAPQLSFGRQTSPLASSKALFSL